MGQLLKVYQNKALVVRKSDETDKLNEAIPDLLFSVGDPTWLAATWSFENAMIMASFGVPSVTPIFRDYKFPCPPGIKPYAHQIRVADFMIRNRKCYVLAGMGSGKTLATTWAMDYLFDLKEIKRALIISRKAIIPDAWERDLVRVLLGRHKYNIVMGDRETKEQLIAQAPEILVINYEGLLFLKEELSQLSFDLVVLDECTKVKNRRAQVWNATYSLVRKAKYAWLLTANPTPQGPLDAFGQIAMLDKTPRGISYTTFEDMVTTQVSKFKRVPKKGWQDTIAKYMKPAIRINTRDCIDLPPISYSPRYIELTKDQKQALDILNADRALFVDDIEVQAINAAVFHSKLIQICCGAVFGSEGEIVHIKPTGRLEETLNLILDNTEGKTLVLAPFRPAVDLIASYLESKGVPLGVVMGGMNEKIKQDIFDSFQKGSKEEMDVIVAIPDSMSHGITLTEASQIIWYGPTTKGEVYLQSIGRMERAGQHRHMRVVELWGHSRERQLYDIAAKRIDESVSLLELYKSGI